MIRCHVFQVFYMGGLDGQVNFSGGPGPSPVWLRPRSASKPITKQCPTELFSCEWFWSDYFNPVSHLMARLVCCDRLNPFRASKAILVDLPSVSPNVKSHLRQFLVGVNHNFFNLLPDIYRHRFESVNCSSMPAQQHDAAGAYTHDKKK